MSSLILPSPKRKPNSSAEGMERSTSSRWSDVESCLSAEEAATGEASSPVLVLPTKAGSANPGAETTRDPVPAEAGTEAIVVTGSL